MMLPRRRLPIYAAIVAAALSAPAHGETIQITIEKLVFSPANATAKVGDSIEWINKDFIAHTATARNRDWDVTIAPNKSTKLVLKKAGSIEYYCRFHPNMKGRITIAPE